MSKFLPLISVVVPHLNQPESLAACLASLADQSIDSAFYEVIVVDNGSSRVPQEAALPYPNMRIISEPQPGPGPARNTGVRAARAELLIFMDADCRADRNWLATALRELNAASERTIFGGDVRIWRDGKTHFTPIEAYESVFAYRSQLYIERQGFCPTGNLAAPRSAFREIGFFADINVAEDIDWGNRARRAGFRIRYVPDMVVFHPARKSLNELYAKWDRHLQHFLNMAKGKPAWRTRWVLRALMIAGSPALDFAKILNSDRVDGFSARLNAMIVLCRIRLHRGCKMIALLHSDGSVIWNRGPAPDRLSG